MAAPRIFKPIYRNDEDGELGRMPDGAIINIGGVVGPIFTVGGKGILFDDGTSSGPGGSLGFTLQAAYSSSTAPATIDLVTGKDLVLNAINSKKFIFDADTGTVTIEGDLNVLGASNVIEGTVSNLDQVNIRMPLPTTVGLTLQPFTGITPTVNLFEVAAVAGGPLVFSIGPTGTTTVTDITVAGTINGVSAATIVSHVSGAGTKHTATQISVNSSALTNVSGTNVQEVLESIDSQLTSIGVGNVSGFEFVQNTPATVWTILHNAGSNRVHATVWDESNGAIWPDSMTIADSNTVYVVFSSPQAGRAVLMLF